MEPTGNIIYLEKYIELCFNDDTSDITESHHILPVKQFPQHQNKSNNIVKLTPYNHLKAHYYLALGIHGITEDFRYKPFWHPVNLMLNVREFDGVLNEEEIQRYSVAREQFIHSITHIQRNMSQEDRKTQKQKEHKTKSNTIDENGYNQFQLQGFKSAKTLGKEGCYLRTQRQIETARKNDSYKRVGEINSKYANKIEENGLSMAQNRALKGHETLRNNPERLQQKKQKLSEAAKNKKRKHCEYCNKTIDISNYTRWHGEKCKKQEFNNVES